MDQLNDLNESNLNGQFEQELKEMNLTHLNTRKNDTEDNTHQYQIDKVEMGHIDKVCNNITNVTAQEYKLNDCVHTNHLKDNTNIKTNKKDTQETEGNGLHMNQSDDSKLNLQNNTQSIIESKHHNVNFKNSI